MALEPSLVQLLATSAGCWFIWRFLRRVVWYNDPFSHIPGPAPESWLMGNLLTMFHKYAWDYHFDIMKKYGRVSSLTWLLKERVLFTYDPKALHHIFVKEQNNFEEFKEFLATNMVAFGPGVLSTVGSHHRKQRKLLNPVFSTAHLRDTTPVFYEVVSKLRNSIEQEVGSAGEDKEIDLLEWLNRTALELIGQSGFGYSFDSLEVGAPQHPFGVSVKELFRGLDVGLIKPIRVFFMADLVRIGSPRFRRWVIDTLPWPALHAVRDIVDIMDKTSKEIFEASKRALKEGKSEESRIGRGKDIMTLLIKANMEAPEDERISDSELLGQISTLTFAGMDTTSNALARIFEMLYKHPDAQEKLRKELREATEQHGEELDHDTLIALPFLDAVIRETMRLWPTVPYVARETLSDSVLPLHQPITTLSGSQVSEIFLPKDTTVVCSLIGCNRDPLIWGDDAAEWKPERWLNTLPNSVPEAKVPGVYSHLMTFLAGGRSCIGFKFAQLEMKVVLHLLVQKFTFAPSGKDVRWQMNLIAQPTTKTAKIDPQTGQRKLEFPVRIGLAK